VVAAQAVLASRAVNSARLKRRYMGRLFFIPWKGMMPITVGLIISVRPQKRPPEGGLFFVTPLARALLDQQL